MNAAWLRPTLRLAPWAPLAAATGVGVAVGQLLTAADAGPVAPVAALLAGAMAAAVTIVLDDRCAALLAAVPTGAGTRLARRLLVLVPAVLVGWRLVAISLADAPGVAAVAALASASVAVGLLAGRRRPELSFAAGAAVASGWPVAPLVTPPALESTIATLWIDRPGPVVAVAVLAAVVIVRG